MNSGLKGNSYWDNCIIHHMILGTHMPDLQARYNDAHPEIFKATNLYSLEKKNLSVTSMSPLWVS